MRNRNEENTCILVWVEDVCREEMLRRELGLSGIPIRCVDSVKELSKNLQKRNELLGVVISAEVLSQEKIFLSELCRESALPVFFWAEEADKEQEIDAFCDGVSDYFSGEQDMRVIGARIRAKLRSIAASKRSSENFVIQENLRMISIGKRQIKLTGLEFQMFSCLYQKRGKVIKREELYQAIWKDTGKNIRLVDVVVKRLRIKLEDTQFVIQTKHKLGYMLCVTK